MIEDMQMRNFAPATRRNNIAHVAAFARFFGQTPDHLDQEAIREYLVYLINDRKMSPEDQRAPRMGGVW
jgi:integrase/recombinase XerD